jgi:hypothetical protein
MESDVPASPRGHARSGPPGAGRRQSPPGADVPAPSRAGGKAASVTRTTSEVGPLPTRVAVLESVRSSRPRRRRNVGAWRALPTACTRRAATGMPPKRLRDIRNRSATTLGTGPNAVGISSQMSRRPRTTRNTDRQSQVPCSGSRPQSSSAITTALAFGRGGSCCPPARAQGVSRCCEDDGATVPRAIPHPTRSASGHVADCETDGYALSAGGRAQDPRPTEDHHRGLCGRGSRAVRAACVDAGQHLAPEGAKRSGGELAGFVVAAIARERECDDRMQRVRHRRQTPFAGLRL